jgi:hypothetical protein
VFTIDAAWVNVVDETFLWNDTQVKLSAGVSQVGGGLLASGEMVTWGHWSRGGVQRLAENATWAMTNRSVAVLSEGRVIENKREFRMRRRFVRFPSS